MSQDNNLLASRTSFDLEYDRAVLSTARLPGRVVCPEDPTIPLYAKGYAGLNVFSERDTRLVNGYWPTSVPDSVLDECSSADYVVDITGYWQDPVGDDLLRTLGFEPATGMAADLRCYRIWRRTTTVPSWSLSRITRDEMHKDESP